MNLAPFFDATLAIQIHIVAAVLAFILGAAVLWRKKGTGIHRVSGRVWVALMVVVSVSSFFIHEIRLWGDYSPIHLISIGVLISLGFAIYAIRRRDIAAHKTAMQATFTGGLIVAGGLTFLPGRMMYEITLEPFFGSSSDPSGLGWIIPLISIFLVAGIFHFLHNRKITQPNS